MKFSLETEWIKLTLTGTKMTEKTKIRPILAWLYTFNIWSVITKARSLLWTFIELHFGIKNNVLIHAYSLMNTKKYINSFFWWSVHLLLSCPVCGIYFLEGDDLSAEKSHFFIDGQRSSFREFLWKYLNDFQCTKLINKIVLSDISTLVSIVK